MPGDRQPGWKDAYPSLRDACHWRTWSRVRGDARSRSIISGNRQFFVEEYITVARDYVVRKDVEFKTWLERFVTGLSSYHAELGLTEEDLLPIAGESGAFGASLTAYEQQKNLLSAASREKQSRRVSAEDTLRPLVRRISSHPGMTDEIRGALGLPVHSRTRTRHAVGPDVPGIFVETDLGAVTIHFGTAPKNERINGKPVWVKGCNIYRKRAGETEFQMLAFESASPYVDHISGDGADYTYVVRYRGTRAHDIGAQSVEMTVAARGAAVG